MKEYFPQARPTIAAATRQMSPHTAAAFTARVAEELAQPLFASAPGGSSLVLAVDAGLQELIGESLPRLQSSQAPAWLCRHPTPPPTHLPTC